MGPGVRKLLWLDFYRREHHNNVTMYVNLEMRAGGVIDLLHKTSYILLQIEREFIY